ncbi:hypothetical protein JB92DRAFT_2797328 [Gautieria morchelliformis]|nr:hypothetical protein JB92DRAFT_2797328 [Gautieria morchelliformis]
MPRVFYTFGVVALFSAFVLQFLVSISLPYLDTLDIARVHFNSGKSTVSQLQDPISELRLGVWAFCVDSATTGATTCYHTGHGYSVGVTGPQNGQVVNIHSSWTRGLAVHPAATGIIFIALLSAMSTHLTVMLVASLLSFLAALVTLVAFAIDIVLFALTKERIHNLRGVASNTDAGPGFWLTLATFLLLLMAGCTVCFGRHRECATSSKVAPITPSDQKRPFWRRWRRTAY